MPRKLVLSGALLAAAAFAARPAAAQESPLAENRRFFVAGGLGLGDCSGNLCGDLQKNTGAHVGVLLGVYYRPHVNVAVGGDLHLNFTSADANDDPAREEGAHYVLANLSVRGLYPMDGGGGLWGGIGLGWTRWQYDSEDVDTGKEKDVWITGIDLALSAGVDYRLPDGWSLGAMARVAFPFWSEYCKEDTDPRRGTVKTTCTDADALDPTKTPNENDLPGALWFLGAVVTYIVDV